MPSVLDCFAEDKYRVGNYAAILYDEKRVDIFGEEWIAGAYRRLRGGMYSRRNAASDKILQCMFSGKSDLGFNSIVAYLSRVKFVVVGEWEEKTFHSCGLAYISTLEGTQDDRMAFVGYGFFPDAWGKNETELMTMLALCYLFREYKLSCIHGVRYIENRLTAKFMER